MFKIGLLFIIGMFYSAFVHFLCSKIPKKPKTENLRIDFYVTYLALEKLQMKAIRKRRAIRVNANG